MRKLGRPSLSCPWLKGRQFWLRPHKKKKTSPKNETFFSFDNENQPRTID